MPSCNFDTDNFHIEILNQRLVHQTSKIEKTARVKCNTISGNIQIKPESVTQSSTSRSLNAEIAVDGNMTSWTHTVCAWDEEIWFKMSFNATYCFSEIMIVQSHSEVYAYRMDNTKVFVVTTMTGRESFCGVLKIRGIWTTVGQTYRIPCHQQCGNEVKLTVLHKYGIDEMIGCIHMYEILAFYSSGLYQ